MPRKKHKAIHGPGGRRIARRTPSSSDSAAPLAPSAQTAEAVQPARATRSTASAQAIKASPSEKIPATLTGLIMVNELRKVGILCVVLVAILITLWLIFHYAVSIY